MISSRIMYRLGLRLFLIFFAFHDIALADLGVSPNTLFVPSGYPAVFRCSSEGTLPVSWQRIVNGAPTGFYSSWYGGNSTYSGAYVYKQISGSENVTDYDFVISSALYSFAQTYFCQFNKLSNGQLVTKTERAQLIVIEPLLQQTIVNASDVVPGATVITTCKVGCCGCSALNLTLSTTGDGWDNFTNNKTTTSNCTEYTYLLVAQEFYIASSVISVPAYTCTVVIGALLPFINNTWTNSTVEMRVERFPTYLTTSLRAVNNMITVQVNQNITCISDGYPITYQWINVTNTSERARPLIPGPNLTLTSIGLQFYHCAANTTVNGFAQQNITGVINITVLQDCGNNCPGSAGNTHSSNNTIASFDQSNTIQVIIGVVVGVGSFLIILVVVIIIVLVCRTNTASSNGVNTGSTQVAADENEGSSVYAVIPEFQQSKVPKSPTKSSGRPSAKGSSGGRLANGSSSGRAPKTPDSGAIYSEVRLDVQEPPSKSPPPTPMTPSSHSHEDVILIDNVLYASCENGLSASPSTTATSSDVFLIKNPSGKRPTMAESPAPSSPAPASPDVLLIENTIYAGFEEPVSARSPPPAGTESETTLYAECNVVASPPRAAYRTESKTPLTQQTSA